MTRTIEFANNEISIDQLPASLQCLIFLLSQTKNLTSDQVYQSLLHANVTQDELMPWATFDHPLTDCYGRQLVYDGGYFEIMVMSWLPGDVSAIHDHGQAQWGAVQCFGQAIHTVYELNEVCMSMVAMTLMMQLQVMHAFSTYWKATFNILMAESSSVCLKQKLTTEVKQ